MVVSTQELTRFEQSALALARMANENVPFKRMQELFLHSVSRQWVRPAVNRRTYVDGVDWLRSFEPDRGVLLAANHRSFFDQYIAMLALYDSGVTWSRDLYFPVRANFFYQKTAGVLINMLVGGGVMYPPIFREREKAGLNRDAVDRLIRFLESPATLVGMHPEGTRGKGPDPYQLLKAQPGVGEVILRAKPIVVPLFIGGLSNDFLGEYKVNFRRDVRRTNPVILCFGEPVDYSEFTDQPVRASLSKRTSDKVLDEIRKLGERERQLREDCREGRIPPDHPHWLVNRARDRHRDPA